jgi:two-component system LytT family response regulator
MIRAIIIDDEKNAVDVLKIQLEQYCEGIELVATCQGGKEGIEAIRSYRPDLVFLDIEMPHINGFDVILATRQFNYNVIFTTAYDQFAIKAFKFSAVDYLLKPIDIQELQDAVERFKKNAGDHSLQVKLELLMQHMNSRQNSSKKIALPTGNELQLVDTHDIIRVESDGNYAHIFLSGGKRITLSKTLKDVEESIKGMPFFRIHQSHLINIDHIDKVTKGESAYIVMRGGTLITISRSKKEEFFDLIRRI